MDLFVLGAIKIFFTFSVIVGIHELGHAIAAKHIGIPVKVYSIGFGPKLYSKKNFWFFEEIRFCIIPFGGFVQVEEGYLPSKTYWQRVYFYANGMIYNVLFSVIILLILAPLNLSSIYKPVLMWIATPFLFFQTFIEGTTLQNLSGPIQIGKIIGSGEVVDPAGTVFQIGFLKLLAVLNAAIAGTNLLPIPPFDGGHILKDTIKLISPKRKHELIEAWFGRLGTIVIVLFLIFVIGNDLYKMIK